MATHLEPADPNAWLESSKSTISDIEPQMEVFAVNQVVGALAARYDVTLWVDRAGSPDLVIQLIAMIYAAAYYRRQYSEDLADGTGLNWAQWLEQSVAGYITSLLNGTIILDEDVLDDSGLRLPAFYPTDMSSLDDPAKFTMMAEF
jgi:hypothetical protein